MIQQSILKGRPPMILPNHHRIISPLASQLRSGFKKLDLIEAVQLTEIITT